MGRLNLIYNKLENICCIYANTAIIKMDEYK